MNVNLNVWIIKKKIDQFLLLLGPWIEKKVKYKIVKLDEQITNIMNNFFSTVEKIVAVI